MRKPKKDIIYDYTRLVPYFCGNVEITTQIRFDKELFDMEYPCCKCLEIRNHLFGFKAIDSEDYFHFGSECLKILKENGKPN